MTVFFDLQNSRTAKQIHDLQTDMLHMHAYVRNFELICKAICKAFCKATPITLMESTRGCPVRIFKIKVYTS